MRLFHLFSSLMLIGLGLVPSLPSLAGGGETGTLDLLPTTFDSDPVYGPIRSYPGEGRWPRHYMEQDHYRRLRARLSIQAVTPIPGWDSQRAIRWKDLIITEDGHFELYPKEDRLGEENGFLFYRN